LPALLAGRNVTGTDVDPAALARNSTFPRACAESNRLPFTTRSFDLIIAHHSLEHFRDPQGTIREIARVLRPDGRLFVSIPDGHSFSDGLYRFLLCGGGHLQRFTFDGIVREIESGTGLYLAGSKELSTSFIFIDKRNFLPAPLGPLTGPLPRRMRWAGIMPTWFFSGMRLFLNLITRLLDRCFATRTSRYGWALAFTRETGAPQVEPASPNVCMTCGAGLTDAPARVALLFYRCPYCSKLNFFFAP
jgi:SAM-dependent methyltransferase